jgi:deoxycytidylate deaminase
MNKTEFYLSRCALAASASDMQFTLGSILVKGGKVLSSGHNHHRYACHTERALLKFKVYRGLVSRTHYDGVGATNLKSATLPFSMHAEMHAIYNATGRNVPPPTSLINERLSCATHATSCIRCVLSGSSGDEGSLLLDSGQDGGHEQRVLWG